MSNSPVPDVSKSVEKQVRELQTNRRTLDINPPALERLVSFTMDSLALLLAEADAMARRRWGDDIQSGDVELAHRRLQGRHRGSYWAIAVGGVLAGAGAQGLAEAILSSKGKAYIIVYSISVLLGIFGFYKGAPRS